MQYKEETKSSLIWIDDEEILRIRIKGQIQVKLEDVIESFDIYRKWGLPENKRLQLMEGATFFSMDKAGQQYAAEHGRNFFIASALVHKSAAIRILFNFFSRFFSSPLPFRLFSSEREALKWLRSFKK